MKLGAKLASAVASMLSATSPTTNYERIIGRAPAQEFNPRTGKTTRYLVLGNLFPKGTKKTVSSTKGSRQRALRHMKVKAHRQYLRSLKGTTAY